MPHFMRLFSCLLVVLSQSHSINVAGRDGNVFLEDILRFYGQNNSISLDNLDNFLLIISDGISPATTEGNPLADLEVSSFVFISLIIIYVIIYHLHNLLNGI